MTYTTLGDPHLGKKFRTGVPLHRLGDRETMVRSQFVDELMFPEAELHVCMGDLFDRFVVPPEVVLFAVDAYADAAEANPNTTYVVMAGNHDVTKDAEKGSSFDLFARLVAHIPNVIVVQDEVRVINGYGFVPYDVFTSAEDQIRQLPDGLPVIFTHLDYTDFGGDHVLPTALLSEKGILHVINGHDHLKRVEYRHGVEVTMTGSMQPYGHSQDGEGNWYVTVSLDQIPSQSWLLNIRVILKPGEELPTDIDCLSLTAIREEDLAMVVDTSEFESLDVRHMLQAVLKDSPVVTELMAHFDEATE